MAVTGLIALGLSKLARLAPASQMTLLLVTMFVNAGNYGLAVSAYAFCQRGLARAVVFYVVNNFLTYTLGVYLASRCSHTRGAAI